MRPYLTAVRLYPELERRDGKLVAPANLHADLQARRAFAQALYTQVYNYCAEHSMLISIPYHPSVGAPMSESNPTHLFPSQFRGKSGRFDALPEKYSAISMGFRKEIVAYDGLVASYRNPLTWRFADLGAWFMLQRFKEPSAAIYGVLGSDKDAEALDAIVSELASSDKHAGAASYLISQRKNTSAAAQRT